MIGSGNMGLQIIESDRKGGWSMEPNWTDGWGVADEMGRWEQCGGADLVGGVCVND